jgi:hypothetical protein
VADVSTLLALVIVAVQRAATVVEQVVATRSAGNRLPIPRVEDCTSTAKNSSVESSPVESRVQRLSGVPELLEHLHDSGVVRSRVVSNVLETLSDPDEITTSNHFILLVVVIQSF